MTSLYFFRSFNSTFSKICCRKTSLHDDDRISWLKSHGCKHYEYFGLLIKLCSWSFSHQINIMLFKIGKKKVCLLYNPTSYFLKMREGGVVKQLQFLIFFFFGSSYLGIFPIISLQQNNLRHNEWKLKINKNNLRHRM